MSERVPARRRARELLLRLLYQVEVCEDPLRETWEALIESRPLPEEAGEYAEALVAVLASRDREIDAQVRRHLVHWSYDRLGATDRGVLRLATAELMEMAGTPARVVIDEAVEIARKFGGEESGRFVNGVLDAIARKVRPGELEEAGMERGS